MYVAEERAATCTELSYKLEKCHNCTLEIVTTGKYPLGHDEVEAMGGKPSCCSEGWNNIVCSRCSKLLYEKVSTIPATGDHATNRVITAEATCGAEGKYEDRCAFSGKLLFSGTIPTTGKHTGGSYKLGEKPTCCSDGWDDEVCGK